MTYSEEMRDEIAEKIFRSYYVPNYPKDKPISEMTPTEQGMYKNTFVITNMALNLYKSHDLDPGRPSRRLQGISDYCEEAGLCMGIEMKPAELILIEDHKKIKGTIRRIYKILKEIFEYGLL